MEAIVSDNDSFKTLISEEDESVELVYGPFDIQPPCTGKFLKLWFLGHLASGYGTYIYKQIDLFD